MSMLVLNSLWLLVAETADIKWCEWRIHDKYFDLCRVSEVLDKLSGSNKINE